MSGWQMYSKKWHLVLIHCWCLTSSSLFALWIFQFFYSVHGLCPIICILIILILQQCCSCFIANGPLKWFYVLSWWGFSPWPWTRVIHWTKLGFAVCSHWQTHLAPYNLVSWHLITCCEAQPVLSAPAIIHYVVENLHHYLLTIPRVVITL